MTSHGNPIDLSSASLLGQLTITPDEHADDRTARILNSNKDKSVERWKGIAIFLFVMFGLVIFAGCSAYVAFLSKTADAETKKWAQTILATIVSGSASFLLGKKAGGG